MGQSIYNMAEIVCKEPKAIDENRGLRRYLELFSLHKQLRKLVSVLVLKVRHVSLRPLRCRILAPWPFFSERAL
jgi:hypothetical protein